MGPSSLFFLAKIRTEILVLDGFRRILSGVWILTVGPSSSFFRKNSHRDFGFGRICWGYGILTVGPSSPLFLAKIRTEILVLEGFVGVVDLNSWSPSSLFFLAKIRTEILVLADFVRVMDLNSWSRPPSLFLAKIRTEVFVSDGFRAICPQFIMLLIKTFGGPLDKQKSFINSCFRHFTRIISHISYFLLSQTLLQKGDFKIVLFDNYF